MKCFHPIVSFRGDSSFKIFNSSNLFKLNQRRHAKSFKLDKFYKFYFFWRKNMKNLQKHNWKSPSIFFCKNIKSAVAGDKYHNWMKIHEKNG